MESFEDNTLCALGERVWKVGGETESQNFI